MICDSSLAPRQASQRVVFEHRVINGRARPGFKKKKKKKKNGNCKDTGRSTGGYVTLMAGGAFFFFFFFLNPGLARPIYYAVPRTQPAGYTTGYKRAALV